MASIALRSFNTEDGIGRATTIDGKKTGKANVSKFQYRRRYREGYNPQRFHRRCFHASAFQYRRRYREGYNTVPLSPWGYWPQMSKMENLRDFSDFQPSAPYALFGISPSRAAQSLATQGFAVFGKKSENLQPFWLSKRFSTLAVYHPMKILSNQIKNEQQASDCLLLITMQVSIVHITESLHDLSLIHI